jgi:polar amino acid transport system substrate-binding protein
MVDFMKQKLWYLLVVLLLASNIEIKAQDCTITVVIVEGAMVEFGEDGGLLRANSNEVDARFTWFDKDGKALSSRDVVRVEKSGRYFVSAYSANDCEAKASILVSVKEVDGTVTIMEGTQVEFTFQGTLTAFTNNPDLSLEWRKDNFKIGEGSKLTVRETGVYTVYLKTEGGRILQTATTNVIIKERIHSVMVGDNLERIARKYYGDAAKASLIIAANPSEIKDEESPLRIGAKLIIPNDVQTKIIKDEVVKVAGNANFPPFSQIDYYKEGMSTEIVRAVFAEMRLPLEVDFMDANRAKAATFNGTVVATYPYVKNVADEETLLFSTPLYKVLNVFFIKKASGIIYEKPKDLKGKTIAIPIGYELPQLQDFYKKGIVNIRPCRTLADCFDLLNKGTVDMVAASEIVGWSTLKTVPNAVASDFKTLDQSLDQTTIHLVISKNHPNAEQLINQFDAAYQRLSLKGAISEIEDRHIDKIQRDNRP